MVVVYKLFLQTDGFFTSISPPAPAREAVLGSTPVAQTTRSHPNTFSLLSTTYIGHRGATSIRSGVEFEAWLEKEFEGCKGS